ncbi:PD-(D/E)XK nuclease family protein [Halobacillus sp. Marseille-Q1614]|uniref:PD-(D/E)XK nuclease family protein n=1 Tax=Halobacillus sp. Marseille-Q1614 TaxID=2709134 RepID=UPI0015706C47|nr:PD-(D/E)XK nuclease family protein [Halobacillus sp. Marseille-Q1614]
MNIFEALNVFYREDTISDFLMNCFKSSNEFLKRFLNEAKIPIKENASFHIDVRVGLGKNIGTPDLVIRVITKDKVEFIIIENKMAASEGNEQTNRYESCGARSEIAKKYKVSKEECKFHFIFLALDTTVQPKNSTFKFLTYRIFLQGNWLLHNETLKQLFKDFQTKLHHFYVPLNHPCESLNSIELDRNQRKIGWQTILFEAFKFNKELILDWGVTGGAGRSNFLFLISKQHWKSNKPYQETGLAQTFYVHVDTYVNLLNQHSNIKEIGVRFETSPYAPHRKISKLAEYDKFIENKNEFGQRLYEKARKQGLSVKRKNSKLLVMSLPIEALTIRETVQDIKRKFVSIEHCIDEVLGEMKKERLII